jgi:hypothetical protein
MFCPNCSANNTTDQKFCRSCGLNLEQTANSLLVQFPNAEFALLQKQERMLERFGNVVFTGFGLVIAAGIVAIIYTILSKWVFSGTQPFGGLLLIAFMIFAGLSLAYVIFAETLKEKRKKLNPRLNSKTSDLVPPKQLSDDAVFEPAVSVVEDTTELLTTEKKMS